MVVEMDPTKMTAADGCFLCAPPEDLVFARKGGAYALCGLGPIVPYYTIVATQEHVPSWADDHSDGGNSLFPLLSEIRAMFRRMGMEVAVGEHGRVPLCVETLVADRHCYHAHLLVFPDVPQQSPELLSNFGVTANYSEWSDSLGATGPGEYFLLSQSERSWDICSGPSGAPRQLLRRMIASSIDRTELASWRDYPNRDDALRYAKELREEWEKRHG